MATILSGPSGVATDVTAGSKRGANTDWPQYADGQWRRFERGQDWAGKGTGAAQVAKARRYAAKIGARVEVGVRTADSVEIRIVPPVAQ